MLLRLRRQQRACLQTVLLFRHSVVSDSLVTPGKNTGSRLPFPSSGDLSNPGIEPIMHYGQILDHLSHQGSPSVHIQCKTLDFTLLILCCVHYCNCFLSLSSILMGLLAVGQSKQGFFVSIQLLWVKHVVISSPGH